MKLQLRSKLFLCVLGSLLVAVALIAFAISSQLEEGFWSVEDADVRGNVLKGKNAIENLIKIASDGQADWASWDDTYKFIADHNDAYLKSNLNDKSIINSLKMNYVALIDDQKHFVFEKMIDLKSGKEISIPKDLYDLVHNKNILHDFNKTKAQFSGGILATQQGDPILIVSKPILTSEGEGPSRGTIAWGYYLSKDVIQDLAKTSKLTINFFSINPDAIDDEMKNSSDGMTTKYLTPDLAYGYTTIKDIYGVPQFMLRVDLPRPIYHAGQQAIQSFVYSMIAVVGFVGLMLLYFINLIVVKRLKRVMSDLDQITKNGKLSARLINMGKDEIGQLAQSTNHMLRSLESSQLVLYETEKQLQQSQKLESIGRLASGIAHDFNNILAGILGYADLLKTRFADDQKATRQLGVIIQSADRGTKLTKELLGFARKGNYEKIKIDLNQKVIESVNMLSATLHKNIYINIDLSEDLHMIEGDANQIEQVIMNLAINSMDAMPDGGKIFIKTENYIHDSKTLSHKIDDTDLPDGKYVRMVFKDSGSGIPEEIRDKIFEPFFTTKPKEKGTGLGLSMIYGIMTNQGGRIILGTPADAGTEFILYFPAVPEIARVEHATAEICTTFEKQKQQKPLLGMSILVIDDEDSIRDWLCDMLEQEGMKTVRAENGLVALELLARNTVHFDAIISDVMMPKLNGIEFCNEFYKNLETKIPVILMSGFAESAQVIELKRIHNIPLLQKPFVKNDLLQLLMHELRLTQSNGSIGPEHQSQ